MLVSAPVFSSADETRSNNVVRLGYFEQDNMMEGASIGGRKSGYVYEYMRELANRNGWLYEYVYGDFDELLDKLSSGEIDLLPYLSATDERRDEYLFPNDSMGQEQYYLASLKDNLKDENGDFIFEGKKVGILDGWASNVVLQDYLRENDYSPEIVSFKSSAERAAAAQRGELDYTFNSSTTKSTDIVDVVAELGEMDYYVGISGERTDLLYAINKSQEEFYSTNSSFISSLTTKYFSDTPFRRNLSNVEKQWLGRYSIIRVGAFTNDAPYSYKNARGQIIGLLPKILEIILDRLDIDIRVDWVLYDTRQEMYEALKTGKIDLICPDFHDYYTAESNGVLISSTILSVNMGALYVGSFKSDTMDIITTPGTRLGASYCHSYYPNSRIIECDSVTDCIDAVVSGDANCAIAHVSTLQNTGKNFSNSDEFVISSLNSSCDICFSCLPKDAALIKILNRGIPLISENEINELISVYNVEEVNAFISLRDFIKTHRFLVLSLLALMAILLVIIIAVAVSSKKQRIQLSELTAANSKLEDTHRELTQALDELEDSKQKAERTIIKRTAELQEKNHELSKSNDEIVELLGELVEMRDRESGLHIKRVKAFTYILCEYIMQHYPKYGLTVTDVELITSASALHDIGKIMISDSILLKPGKLTKEEFDEMKTHTIKGCELLKKAPDSWSADYLNTSLDICRFHHEKWDGKGYPEGLKGDAIPVSAQIVSIADCFDALTSERVYKRAYTNEEAFGMIMTGQCGVFSDIMLDTLENCRDKMFHAASNPQIALEREAEIAYGSNKVKGLYILLIDDNSLSIDLNKDILESEGAEVVCAMTGKEAIDLFKDNGPFDVVITDLVMPEMDGFEISDAIRKLENGKADSVPIIALSAEPSKFSTDNTNINAFMEKPLVVSELTSRLLSIMKEKNASLEEKYTISQQRANIDALTGVNSITAYTDAIEEITEEMRQSSQISFAIVISDINNLKDINDTYGHDVGDIYIKNCSRVFENVFGRSKIYRIGGDEFVAIARGYDYDRIDEKMDELADSFCDAEKIPDVEKGKASMSFGMAVYDPGTDYSVSSVVKRADAEMYIAKRRYHETHMKK